MKARGKSSIIIEFDRTEDKDEIEALAHFFLKCKRESDKAGFTNLFTKQDREIISKFIDKTGLYEGSPD